VEVLSLLKESTCDLVLLDILMPELDGVQTLAKIKQDAQLRELPVIMISALDELQSVVRCIEMGAVDYLPKPFNRVLLRARIGASLDRKRLVDRERRKTEELERTLTLLEDAQDQLVTQASRDGLTGLANRRTVELQLDARVKRGEPFTAIYIDLNGFKKINDTYGHAAGDELLRQVGGRLRTAFRAGDTIGRWGGDEFVAFVEGGSAEMIRIQAALEKPFAIEGVSSKIAVGAAVGAASWRSNETAAELLHRADFAMYEEKLRRAG
jgi:diguanylate cyclase (GGDEF)-like protein